MYSTLSITDWAWIAGLLEGEGCFGVQDGYCRIYLNMTDEDVVSKFARLLDGNLRTQDMSKYNPKAKLSYRVTISHRDKVASILTAIFPFMSARRRESIKAMVDAFKAKNYDVPLPDINAPAI